MPRGNEVDAELWENLDNGNEIDVNAGRGEMNEKDDGGFFKVGDRFSFWLVAGLIAVSSVVKFVQYFVLKL